MHKGLIMSYIKFDKKQLVNLEYSLKRELLRSNRAGAYASTTIVGCNTRKYHGLLVVPEPGIDNENHVLLSSLDETIIQHDAEFNLAIHKFHGEVYHPKGHKYIRDLEADPIPVLTYRVGGVILTKERLFSSEADRILIRYTLIDAHSRTTLRIKPFLAYRNIHKLSKANPFVDQSYHNIDNGIKVRMYKGYSDTHIQFSKKADYFHTPDWFYNFEYEEEKNRGYDYLEDLYSPGYFELELKKGESVVVAVGTAEAKSSSLKRSFDKEIHNRIPRDSFRNCLINAAQQFIVRRDNNTEVVAGFPWFGRWGRDTFIALPGLTLSIDDQGTFEEVIDTMLRDRQGPLFPNIGKGNDIAFNSVDAPLWFFWAMQQYADYTGDYMKIWNKYKESMTGILDGFRDGTLFNIRMHDNGLIFAGIPGKALTWMDAIVEGQPVTPRIGMPVEINALWYNAIMFSLELAQKASDQEFISRWSNIAEKIPAAFEATFWLKDHDYLADYVNGDEVNVDVRPNMVFATSLKYTPVDMEKCGMVLEIIKSELLTERGLRTLSPENSNYKGVYCGDQAARDRAYHNGTVWPWLLGHFVEGYLKLYGKEGLPLVKRLYHNFESNMTEHGIGTISEVFDGDPPHAPGGAISQAWSVAELLRISAMIEKYEN